MDRTARRATVHRAANSRIRWKQLIARVYMYICECVFSSVQFSHSVVSDSLPPHELQHARPPCPSPTPGVYPNSCPSSRWCHPAISSSVIPFSSCPQSFPASGSFPMSQLFESGGQSTGVSASTSVLPMNTQEWSPLGWSTLYQIMYVNADQGFWDFQNFILIKVVCKLFFIIFFKNSNLVRSWLYFGYLGSYICSFFK